tara:strand:+ start:595 stop:834 length:240 start_codon:yes stop_codon:yes gene_type:complete
MDFQSYCFLGVGVAISVIGFFLKKEAQKAKQMDDKIRTLEVSQAQNCARDDERWHNYSKVLEDRRQDIMKLYEEMSKKK